MRNGLVVAVLLLLDLTLGANCHAQPSTPDHYPNRTIKIITNVGVGGTYDILARALADELQKTLGKPVVVEPRPGGNFLLAGRACAEAAADGYTVCALTGETVVYSELLFKKVPFDSRKNFAPVSNLIFNTQLLVVSASLGSSPSMTWRASPSNDHSPTCLRASCSAIILRNSTASMAPTSLACRLRAVVMPSPAC